MKSEELQHTKGLQLMYCGMLQRHSIPTHVHQRQPHYHTHAHTGHLLLLPWGTCDRKVLRAARDMANASVTKKESSVAFEKKGQQHTLSQTWVTILSVSGILTPLPHHAQIHTHSS